MPSPHIAPTPASARPPAPYRTVSRAVVAALALILTATAAGYLLAAPGIGVVAGLVLVAVIVLGALMI